MNGRVYDYNLGRFLSVDPYIHGTDSQGINPYSYIFNNPLSGTDPSGYKPKTRAELAAEKCAQQPNCVSTNYDNSGSSNNNTGNGNQNKQQDNTANSSTTKVDSKEASKESAAGAEGEPLADDVSDDAGQDGSTTNQTPQTWDPLTNERIQGLDSELRDPAANFINAVEVLLDIQLRISSGFRDFDTQEALYAQGRTTPGSIVTNARGGQSYHNYGLSFDVVPIVNGQVNYNVNWSDIGVIGEVNGLNWGGRWNTPDRPHFYYRGGD